MPVVTLRDTSMFAINVGAAGSRTRLTPESSAKQMQRDQCQGCASSSSSRTLLRLLQVRCNKSRKPQHETSAARIPPLCSQVHGDPCPESRLPVATTQATGAADTTEDRGRSTPLKRTESAGDG
ncbi:hypothetical protein ALC53_06958 [Atta colombica]|uniref:Uncharacterized protein n=1 Tax=Atta colombica TaxID=520822 RepID=A0A195BD32_9HYME|nr:hypothetical protein ALC53_06958 [Atta colombica]